jgi:Na+/melibiose symporter-like transporter
VALRTVGGYTVRLRDVASVEEAAASERSRVRLNGVPSVSTGVIRNATANPLDISAGVREVMPRIQQDLPPGLRIDVANDNSVFIARSVESVYRTVAESVVLVALVVFVFLRTLRASIIPLVTIPVSLIGTFAVLLAAGFSANTVSLLAMVPAVFLPSRSTVDDTHLVPLTMANVGHGFKELMDGFKEAFACVPFRKLCFATFLIFNAFNTVAAFSFFIVVYHLFAGNTASAGIWPTLFGSIGALMTTFAVIPTVAWMSSKVGKKKAFMLSQGVSILGYVLL